MKIKSKFWFGLALWLLVMAPTMVIINIIRGNDSLPQMLIDVGISFIAIYLLMHNIEDE